MLENPPTRKIYGCLRSDLLLCKCVRARVDVRTCCTGVCVCARAHKMLWDTVSVFYMILYHLSSPNACQKHTNSIFCCLAFPSHKTENGYIYSLIFIAHMHTHSALKLLIEINATACHSFISNPFRLKFDFQAILRLSFKCNISCDIFNFIKWNTQPDFERKLSHFLWK